MFECHREEKLGGYIVTDEVSTPTHSQQFEVNTDGDLSMTGSTDALEGHKPPMAKSSVPQS